MENREQFSETMERLERSIDKEVEKLKYYIEFQGEHHKGERMAVTK